MHKVHNNHDKLSSVQHAVLHLRSARLLFSSTAFRLKIYHLNKYNHQNIYLYLLIIITMVLESYTTLFYVDDDEDDRLFFEEVTGQIGENISLFELGDQMLLQLENPPPYPSVIFLDLNMPVKDGFEVLQEIKSAANLKDVPVIILSTTSNPETVNRCFNLGASLYVKKSLSVSDLKKSVEFVLSIDWEQHAVTPTNFEYKS